MNQKTLHVIRRWARATSPQHTDLLVKGAKKAWYATPKKKLPRSRDENGRPIFRPYRAWLRRKWLREIKASRV